MKDLKSDFLDLFHASGWSQAEVARKLEITPGGVSGLIKGTTNPSAGLLKLFRLVLHNEKPEALAQPALKAHYPRPPEESVVGMESADVRDAANMLNEIATEDPAKFAEVKSVIVTYRRSLRPEKEARFDPAKTGQSVEALPTPIAPASKPAKPARPAKLTVGQKMLVTMEENYNREQEEAAKKKKK